MDVIQERIAKISASVGTDSRFLRKVSRLGVEMVDDRSSLADDSINGE